jgi:hypothetical protein
VVCAGCCCGCASCDGFVALGLADRELPDAEPVEAEPVEAEPVEAEPAAADGVELGAGVLVVLA